MDYRLSQSDILNLLLALRISTDWLKNKLIWLALKKPWNGLQVKPISSLESVTCFEDLSRLVKKQTHLTRQHALKKPWNELQVEPISSLESVTCFESLSWLVKKQTHLTRPKKKPWNGLQAEPIRSLESVTRFEDLIG